MLLAVLRGLRQQEVLPLVQHRQQHQVVLQCQSLPMYQPKYQLDLHQRLVIRHWHR
jgi:hypothetical protein